MSTKDIGVQLNKTIIEELDTLGRSYGPIALALTAKILREFNLTRKTPPENATVLHGAQIRVIS